MLKKLIFTLLLLCSPSAVRVEDAQPNVIVLIIGVDTDAKEADDFALEATSLRNSIIPAFASYNPIVKSILRKDATRENCLNGFKWIKEVAGPNDLVVIYVGAHGGSKQLKEFKFCAADKPIYGTEIKDMLAGLPTDVLLIMDTCHSGAITGDFDNVPNVFIIAACSHEEKAFSWGLCVTLMEAFIYGDADKDGVVTIKEIATYVKDHPKYGMHPVVSNVSERPLINPTRAAA